MAEFDDAHRAGERRPRSASSAGYRQDRRLLAVSDRGAATTRCTCTSNKLPLIVLLGGIAGRHLAATCCSTTSRSSHYPINIGGRPLHSWPTFIVITFEMTMLLAALAGACFGMFALNGLPMPYHPVFNVPRFALASRNRFFLCIEATDPLFDRDEHGRLSWSSLEPREVSEVAHVSDANASCSSLRRCVRCACAVLALLPAAARTCTTSPSTFRCGPAQFFTDGALRAAAGGRDRGARPPARRRRRSTPARAGRQTRERSSRVPVTQAVARARAGALQHLLLALPRPAGQRPA